MSLIRPTESAFVPPHVIRGLLQRAETIAVVGASTDPWRPSFGIAGYLKRSGYRIRPVNPLEPGCSLHGEPFVASLSDISERIDIALIFRRPDALMEVVGRGHRRQDPDHLGAARRIQRSGSPKSA